MDIWIAGAFAAFTVDLLVYPLDTVKTRMQSPDYRKLYTNGVEAKVSRSMFRGVYQGIGSVILATLPSCKSTHLDGPEPERLYGNGM
jgi:solute carrier family 25 S-adenosylmethionine transporter 26